MKLSVAFNILFACFSSSNFAHGGSSFEKGSMGIRNDDERKLSDGGGGGDNGINYEYGRNYVVIIGPNDSVRQLPNGGREQESITVTANEVRDGEIPDAGIQGSSTIFNGIVLAPDDVKLVSRPNGVEKTDPFPDGVTFFKIPETIRKNLRYAGDKQPKSPIPHGDSAYFFHGECVALSSAEPNSISEGLEGFADFLSLVSTTSQSCKLNLCLGGGGFDCIAMIAGGTYNFDIGRTQTFLTTLGKWADSSVSATGSALLPPPYPATIIGGTGALEGIEGRADISTVCGRTAQVVGIDATTDEPTETPTTAAPHDHQGTKAPILSGRLLGNNEFPDGFCNLNNPCKENFFCNFALGDKAGGTCESCNAFTSAANCEQGWFLNREEAIFQCKQKCFLPFDYEFELGYIVQTIRVRSNMPLPVAP